MLSFLTFLKEESEQKTAFKGHPHISVMSLDDFTKNEPVPQNEDSEFGIGAKTRVATDPEMQDYLDRVFTKKKEKGETYTMPHVHGKLLKMLPQAGSIDFITKPDSDVALDVKNNKLVDIEELKKLITTRPKGPLLSQNEKMAKSGFFNFTIPALTGLAVNEKTNEFVIVSTCPGAGACQRYCYAMKGTYIAMKEVFSKQSRVLNYLLNDPEGFFAQMESEIRAAVKRYKREGKTVTVRWHDAGDFFSDEYLKLFFDKLVNKLPEVNFYAYTKIANIAKSMNSPDTPENFTVSFSQGAKPEQEKMVDLEIQKHSKVVPKELFGDLVNKVMKVDMTQGKAGKKVPSWEYKTPDALSQFKYRLSDKYGIPVESILTYQELMKTPKSNNGKWNVIVTPGDGDDAAARKDVLGVYLLVH